jgi:predicted SnoaL-like aldol condensation-catalyzing enzyme
VTALAVASPDEAIDHDASTQKGPDTVTTDAATGRNKRTIDRLFQALRTADTSALDALIADDYAQHNPLAGNGLAAVKDFFRQLGPVDVDVHRVIAEGDLAAVHTHNKTLGMAAVDIYRFNAEGKIIEHWDVLQQVPETTASGNDMFSQLT